MKRWLLALLLAAASFGALADDCWFKTSNPPPCPAGALFFDAPILVADQVITIPYHPVQGGGGAVTPSWGNTSSKLDAGNAHTAALAMTGNVTSGTLVVVAVQVSTAAAIGTAITAGMLTKTSGTSTIGTIALDATATRTYGGGSNRNFVGIYSVPVTGTGSLTLTFNIGGTIESVFIAIEGGECTDCDVSGSRVNDFDGTAASTGTSAAPPAVTTGGAGIILSTIFPGSPFGTQTLSTPTNYTLISEQENDAQQNHSFVYRATGTDITDGPTWTIGTSSEWLAVSVAYKSSTP